jgi:hypothetical protein
MRQEQNMRFPVWVAITVGSALAATNCLADTRVLARAGAWQAFGGTTNNGTPVCGMSSSGAGKYFGRKYFAGESTLTVQLGNNQWTVKDKVKVKVEMRFDRQSPWNATAIGMHFGDGDAGLEFDISRNQLDQFMREFRGADAIAIRFPGENVSDWRGSLAGTDAVSNSFTRCVRGIKE